MSKTANKIEKISVDIILAVVIMLWLNAGFFTVVQARITSTGMYGIVGAWFILTVSRSSVFFKKVVQRLFLFLPPIILALVLGDKNDSLFKCIMYIFFLTCIKDFYTLSGKGCKLLLVIWLVDTIAVVLNTIRLVLQNPMMVRYVSMRSAAFQPSAANVCASFGNVLCYVILALVLFYKILNNKSNFWGWLGFFVLMIVISMSQITILIGALFVGMALIFLIRTCDTLSKFFIIGIPVCFLFTIIVYNIPAILTALSKMSFVSDLIRDKIGDIVRILSGSADNARESQSRIDKYEMSFESFINNPIIGSLGEGKKIGGHSAWLDALGMYGLLSIPIFVWHYKLMKEFVSFAGKNAKKYYMCIAILFTIIGFLDPIIFQNAYIMFVFVVPMAVKVKRDDELKNNQADVLI